jgi:NADH-quinone oxidoreductase subunit M
LAGILLKVGAYGFLRFLVPLLKDGITYYFTFFSIFCILSILFSSLAAIVQTDMKKIVAYSSIAHMNYIMLGLMTYEINAVMGSILYLIAHGFISSGLFFLIGYLYDNYGSRDIQNFNSIQTFDPLFAFYFFIFNFANLAFPLTASYIAELLILSSLSSFSLLIIIFSVIPLFLILIYTL